MSITICRCTAADVGHVVRFIDEEWERGHVLATSRDLLEWQYRNGDGGYAFVVARRDAEVVGILGYIATRRYDSALADANVVWLTTWKVRADANVAGLGLSLLQYLARVEPHVAIGAIGFNPATRPMYVAMGYRMGELDHYVAKAGTPTSGRQLSAEPIADPTQCAGLTIASAPAVTPRKTARYFARRYLSHPFYDYTVVALRDRSGVVGLVAARVAEHEGGRALRIVDVLGSAYVVVAAGAAVQSAIRAAGAAYADLYCAGIDARVLSDAGFSRVDPDGREIVPDHFEPYEHRNVRLPYAIRGGDRLILFKGDADQDRPNRVMNGLA